MFTATTHNIKITAFPAYLAEQSDPANQHYVWAYTIVIENHGSETVQLVNRYWRITDATGHVQEVRGPGVIGEHPVLEPGVRYQYTSGVSLKTASGIMLGNYEMRTDSGDLFLVDVPAFSLDSPEQIKRPN